LSVVENLGLTNKQKNDVMASIEALQRDVDGHLHETVECRNFCRRVQQPGEMFDDFVIALRELVKTCKFCFKACTEKSIRDQIIGGARDCNTIEDLLQENNLTLAKTISMCRSREAARKHCSDIHAPGWWQLYTNLAKYKYRRAQDADLTCTKVHADSALPITRCAYPAKKIGHFVKV